MDNEITAEEIAQHYSAAMDSVNLINAVIADPDAYIRDETILQRNIGHLQIMVAKDYWTDEDMTPFNDAIAVDTTEFDNQFN
jgi:hypothetical protein|tara:strand:- start:500 stop:745 length:246 start_codon:yes stop_codon:yes gene_type:complete